MAEFLQFFTKAGGWVLDPFCGSGATLVSCLEQGRNGVGIELSEKYAEVARHRLEQQSLETGAWVMQGDSRDVASPALWEQLPVRVGRASSPPSPSGYDGRLARRGWPWPSPRCSRHRSGERCHGAAAV